MSFVKRDSYLCNRKKHKPIHTSVCVCRCAGECTSRILKVISLERELSPDESYTVEYPKDSKGPILRFRLELVLFHTPSSRTPREKGNDKGQGGRGQEMTT